MLWSNLLHGTLLSDFIIIHDNKEAKGGLLLNEFMKQNVKLGNVTNLLCFEDNPALEKNTPSNVNFHHYCVSDPRSWFKNGSDHMSTSSISPSEILKQIQNQPKIASKCVIIIDSLSLFELLYKDDCYKMIHRLVNDQSPKGKQQQQIICLVHDDVFPGGNKSQLMFELLATTNIIVFQENNMSYINIRHRKASGRIIESVEQIFIDKTGELVTKELKKSTGSIHRKDNTADWINSDVTFKLDLGEEEKRARSELVLPYLKNNEQINTGQIIYEPDERDDWDEEDPDDDLNI